MMRGSTPALAAARMRASGFLPLRSPHLRLPIRSAAAPSFTPEALPAVTTPPSKSGFSLASASMVLSRRGCSSALSSSGAESFFREGKATGMISPA